MVVMVTRHQLWRHTVMTRSWRSQTLVLSTCRWRNLDARHRRPPSRFHRRRHRRHARLSQSRRAWRMLCPSRRWRTHCARCCLLSSRRTVLLNRRHWHSSLPRNSSQHRARNYRCPWQLRPPPLQDCFRQFLTACRAWSIRRQYWPRWPPLRSRRRQRTYSPDWRTSRCRLPPRAPPQRRHMDGQEDDVVVVAAAVTRPCSSRVCFLSSQQVPPLATTPSLDEDEVLEVDRAEAVVDNEAMSHCRWLTWNSKWVVVNELDHCCDVVSDVDRPTVNLPPSFEAVICKILTAHICYFENMAFHWGRNDVCLHSVICKVLSVFYCVWCCVFV